MSRYGFICHYCTPVEQLQLFERGRIVSLQEAGWTYRHIAKHVGWCAAASSSGLWNIPTPVDPVLDGRVVQTDVKIDVLCKQPEQHLVKKSGHMLQLLC